MKKLNAVLIILLAAILSASIANAVTVTVPGAWTYSDFWTDTGLTVSAGDIIHVTATGAWTAWTPEGYYGAEGSSTTLWFDQWLNPNNLGDGTPDPAAGGAPSITSNIGALIAYIGPDALTPSLYGNEDYAARLSQISNMVLLGSDVTVSMPSSGKLWLGMNADSYGGNLSDNAGSLRVTVQAVPEPSSLMALVCGISCMGGAMWRRRK